MFNKVFNLQFEIIKQDQNEDTTFEVESKKNRSNQEQVGCRAGGYLYYNRK